MSLVGNLEDLGLGDILQIVSLSRKSGVLGLRRSEHVGAIIFQDGLVVSAVTSEHRPHLAELLVERGLLKSSQQKSVLQLWEDTGKRASLAKLVETDCGVAHAQIQAVIKDVVEHSVYQLFAWQEGNFRFELKDVQQELAQLDPEQAQFVLDQGLNPQYLAMEGARLLDESRALGTQVGGAVGSAAPVPKPEVAPQASPPEPEPPQQVPKPAAEKPPPAPAARSGEGSVVLFIDDDSLTLECVKKALETRHLTAEAVNGTNAGLQRFDALLSEGRLLSVVVDLLMPRSDNSGILGGLEVIEHVRRKEMSVRLVVVTDYENDDARKKAESNGIDAFLRKPRKAQLSASEETPELQAFMNELAPLLATWALKDQETPRGPAVSEPAPQPSRMPGADNGARAHDEEAGEDTIDIRGELAKEFEEGFFGDAPEAVEPGAKSRGLAMLKTMTDELNDPNSNVEITLLVLRFAAELMGRAIIFIVTPKDICGLGEFGVEIDGDLPLKRVRKMRVPVGEPSILREVLDRRTPLKGPLKPTRWNDYIVEMLGGARPTESFAAPIVSSGKVVAILYGDNIPEREPIGDTESLEIFLVQAGMAMDRALLERQLKKVAQRTE